MFGHSPLSEVPLSTPVRFVVLEFRTRRLGARAGFKRFDSDARPTLQQVVFVAQELARLAKVSREAEKKVYVVQEFIRKAYVSREHSRITTVLQETPRVVKVA